MKTNIKMKTGDFTDGSNVCTPDVRPHARSPIRKEDRGEAVLCLIRVIRGQLLAGLLGLLAVAGSAGAATLTVTNLADSGPGSLRQHVANAGPGDTIDFAVEGTITFTNGPIYVGNIQIRNNNPETLTLRGNGSDYLLLIDAPTTLCGLKFSGGRSPQNGGAIYVVDYRTLNVTNCVFEDNIAERNGGAIWAMPWSTVVIDSSRFISNSTFFFSSSGGAIGANGSSNMTINNCFFEGNRAAGRGGAIASGRCFIQRCEFVSNSAEIGGAAWLHDSTISNSVFVFNTAARGSALSAGLTEIWHTTALSNLVDTDVLEGGTIVNEGGLNLNHSVLSYNTSTRVGSAGLVCLGGSWGMVSRSVLCGNVSSNATGGGISFPGQGNLVSPLLVHGSLVCSNIAARAGGIGGLRPHLYITDSTIQFNRAVSGDGGGILNQRGKLLLSTNNLIHANEAFGNGGGLWNQEFTGDFNFNPHPFLIQTTISSNRALTGDGGGIYVNGLSLALTNCTIIGNDAAGLGGGIYSPSAGSRNTIVAGNTASGGDPDCSGLFGSGGFNLIGSSAGSNGFVHGQNGDQVGTLATPVDPILGPLRDNGGPTWTHALLPGSPALDAGHSSGLSTDQRGGARAVLSSTNNVPGSDGSDIGAFEAGGYVRLTSIARTNTTAHLQLSKDLTTGPAPAYYLQCRAAFGVGGWEELPGSISGTNTILSLTDIAATNTQNFYRVRVGP